MKIITKIAIISMLLSSGSIYAQTKVTDTLSIGAVIVTGTQLEQQSLNLPYSTSVVTNKEIRRSGQSSIMPILSDIVPGLFITERGTAGYGVYSGSAGSITMRGVGGSPTTGVLIAIDGHPQYMGINGHHIADSYLASYAERVEVVRGPASAIYGSNAMGGVINIITKREKRNSYSLNAEAGYGSFNTQRYVLNSGVKYKRFDAFISVDHDRTNGSRPNGGFNGTNIYAKVGYELSKSLRLTLDYNMTAFKSIDPGTTKNPSTTDTLYAKVLRNMMSLTLENKSEKTSGAIKVFYNNGFHNLYYGWRSNDHNTGVAAYQNLSFFKNNTVTFGFDYKNFGGTARDIYGKVKIPEGSKTINEIAGYISMQQSLFGSKLMLNAAIRLDNNSAYGNSLIPQGGISYRPTEITTIRGSISKGFRSPTIRELYYYPTANDSLKPESMMNYELSVVQYLANKKARFEITAYLSQGSNMIEATVTPLGPINTNSGSFLNKGIEFSYNHQITPSIKAVANYSYLHLAKPMLAAPKHNVYLSGQFTVGRFDLDVNYKYVGDLYVQVGKSPVKEYFSLLNSRVNFRAHKMISLYADFNNILDTKYQYSYLYPMPGFNVMGGIRFALHSAL